MGPLAPTLVNEHPEVTNAVRMVSRWSAGRRTMSYGENRFNEGAFLFAEPSFFEIFDFAMVRGNPQTTLTEPLTWE